MAVAQRIYANALFEAAKERGRLEAVSDDLHAFADAVDSVPELRELLVNPQLDTRAKAPERSKPETRRPCNARPGRSVQRLNW